MIAPILIGRTSTGAAVYSYAPLAWNLVTRRWSPLVVQGKGYRLGDAGDRYRLADWITAAEVCVSAHHDELHALVSTTRTLRRRVREHTDDRMAFVTVENLLCDLKTAKKNARRLIHTPRRSDSLVHGVRAAHRHRPMTADDVLVEEVLSAVIHARVCTGQRITQAGYDRAVAILTPLYDDDSVPRPTSM